MLLYLLQLVQALKYENFDSMRENDVADNKDLMTATIDDVKSSVQCSIIKEKEFAENSTSSSSGRPASPTGNLFESSAKGHSSSDASLSSNLSAMVGAIASDVNSLAISRRAEEGGMNIDKPDLATFLIHRACENTTLANYSYW